jgi:uncharacterized membrane-anchored protein YhcB (DUF1043 family)
LASSDDPARRLDIQNSLNAIVQSSDEWLGRLKKREFRVRLASSLITTVLGAFIAGAGALVFIFLRYGLQGLLTLFKTPSRADPLAASLFLAALLVGVATYFLLKRRHDSQLKELSNLISQMKKTMNESEQKTKGNESGGITQDALSLADKILTLLPDLVRKREQDSLLFGFVAFIIASTVSGNLGIGILVGVIVWIYFRYEFGKTYRQQISKFEEQKRVFDQKKKEFIETL